MFSAAFRDVPKPALMQHIAEYLQQQGRICVPSWYKAGEAGTATAWFGEAAEAIIVLGHTPMLKPKQANPDQLSLHGRAFHHLIAEFESIGWIKVDCTGLLLVTDACTRKLERIARETSKQ
jgi:ribosomal protein S19E (S16A)